jgi:hypothetical protein
MYREHVGEGMCHVYMGSAFHYHRKPSTSQSETTKIAGRSKKIDTNMTQA